MGLLALWEFYYGRFQLFGQTTNDVVPSIARKTPAHACLRWTGHSIPIEKREVLAELLVEFLLHVISHYMAKLFEGWLPFCPPAEECAGEGMCHGCLKWCNWCGDVGHTCEMKRGECDCHPVCHVSCCDVLGCWEHQDVDIDEIMEDIMES